MTAAERQLLLQTAKSLTHLQTILKVVFQDGPTESNFQRLIAEVESPAKGSL